MNKFISFFLIFGIVVISGCVGGPDIFKGFFGPSQPTVEQTPDLLIFTSKGIIPNPPISANTDFTVWTELKNQAEPGTPELKNVEVFLYDYGICIENDPISESKDWNKDTNKFIFNSFSPGQIERLEMNFKAPSNEKIGFIEADCPIRYYVNYITSARSQDDFNIISSERLKELQRLGESPTWKDQPQYVGIGPVKIYFDWKTSGPVEEGKTIQFSIQIVNRGDGVYDEVKEESLYLILPKEWKSSDSICNDKFKKIHETDKEIIYKNVVNFKLINKQTPEIVCTLTAPQLDIPEKNYIIKANITNYNYKLYDEQIVHIKPTT